jgi:nucleoside-diphosphate-sugar epimerase
MKLLVTGGSGMVGSALLRGLRSRPGCKLRATVRAMPAEPVPSCEYVVLGDLGEPSDSRGIAAGCDVVVHTAARVHVMSEGPHAAAAYRRTNVAGTLNLARQAAACGVRRFIFLSSVKVNGESTAARPFTEDDPANAAGPYAQSKWEAEQGLHDICAKSGMQYVIVRPPLVYGPGVRANFRALALAVIKGIPLPLGSVANSRSLVALDNLVDFVCACIDSAPAANQTFLVSDGHDLSTAELVRIMAGALDRPARLLPVPMGMLLAVGAMTGRREAVRRLLENLQVDIGKAQRLLGWRPPVSVEEGMRRAMHGIRRA